MKAADFLKMQCQAYEDTHSSLVTQMLLPWQPGLNVSAIFEWPGYDEVKPVAYVLNGELRLHNSMKAENWRKRHYALAYWEPIMREITEIVYLPDLALLLNPIDGPFAEETRLPMVGSCQIRRKSIAVTWPYSLREARYNNATEPSRAGVNDTRIGKAVFRGSPTGWHWGKRRAIMLTGLRHPDVIDAGLASMDAGCGQCGEVDEAELQMFSRPGMPLDEQNDGYKYIITADGNCISHRMKDLLSSDSAVFWIQSFQEEWYYPLLVPGVHYLPVQYEPTLFPKEAGLDLNDLVRWAVHHAAEVAQLVDNARAFARLHLSTVGQRCFVVRFLQKYHEMLQGLDALEALIEAESPNIAEPLHVHKPHSQGIFHRLREHVTGRHSRRNIGEA